VQSRPPVAIIHGLVADARVLAVDPFLGHRGGWSPIVGADLESIAEILQRSGATGDWNYRKDAKEKARVRAHRPLRTASADGDRHGVWPRQSPFGTAIHAESSAKIFGLRVASGPRAGPRPASCLHSILGKIGTLGLICFSRMRKGVGNSE